MTALQSPTVTTSSGSVRGTTTGRGVAWRSVPFAAPPIGPRRFRAPEPATPWPGVRPAVRFAPAATQPTSVLARGAGMSEDCLYLNVYAPAVPDGRSRPVMVWIHGGGFTGGRAADYDGAALAALGDIVVVTVNYRLGAFGLVDWRLVVDAEVDSNLGVRDQVAALQWVHDNIAGFGGDPSRVTVAGESAGSICTSLLLCAPSAAGLFRGAIMQSGTYSLVHGDQVRREVTRRYAEILELKRADGARLWELSARELLAAQQTVDRDSPGTVAAAPWFDGDVVPASLAAAQATHAPGVTVLAGSTRDEVEGFRRFPGDIVPTTRRQIAIRLTDSLDHDHAAAVLRAYPDNRTGNRALASDFLFGAPAPHLAERHAAAGGRAFAYRFDAGVPWLGATHAAELPYLWGWRGPVAWLLRGAPSAARLSLGARLQWHWARFVADLDPGPEWPAYVAPERQVRLFEVNGDRTLRDADRARRLAWAGADVMPRS